MYTVEQSTFCMIAINFTITVDLFQPATKQPIEQTCTPKHNLELHDIHRHDSRIVISY